MEQMSMSTMSEDSDRCVWEPEEMGARRVVHVGGALNDQAADGITMQAFQPGFECVSGAAVQGHAFLGDCRGHLGDPRLDHVLQRAVGAALVTEPGRVAPH